jgi:hypothetical protein
MQFAGTTISDCSSFSQRENSFDRKFTSVFLFIGSTTKTAKRRATGQQQDNVTLPVKRKFISGRKEET